MDKVKLTVLILLTSQLRLTLFSSVKYVQQYQRQPCSILVQAFGCCFLDLFHVPVVPMSSWVVFLVSNARFWSLDFASYICPLSKPCDVVSRISSAFLSGCLSQVERNLTNLVWFFPLKFNCEVMVSLEATSCIRITLL